MHKYGHDLSSCKVMLDQAQKVRASWQTGKSGGGQNDHLFAKKQNDKDMHAFVSRMVENAVNQQEKKRKAGTVHFAAKMPSKDDDDDSDNENELNQFESLSINEANDNEESSSVLTTEVQTERPLVKNVAV